MDMFIFDLKETAQQADKKKKQKRQNWEMQECTLNVTRQEEQR